MRAAVVAVAFAAALSGVLGARFTLDKRSVVPTEWLDNGRADSNAGLTFYAALRQRNLAALDTKFWAISTPGSPQYGKFMTMEEMSDLIGTSAEDMAVALGEFQSVAGIDCAPHVDALACKGSVAAVEALFQTELHHFKHAENGRNVILYTGSLTLPKSVEGVVSFVEGFSRFPTPHKIAKRQVAAGTDYVITPEGLDSLLSLNGAKGTGAVIQSVAEFQSEPAYTPNELATFSKETSVPTITVAKKIGPFSPGGDPESSLDIQYIASVGQGNTNWFYTQADWLYSFAVQFNNISTPPDVVSMSYGWYEGDQCSIETDPSICKTSYGYVERVNTEFQKLGARGVTLLASSGDSGAHGRTDVDCQYKVLRPAYPAASPYVTAVGATMIKIGEGAVGGKCPVCTKGSYAKQCAVNGTQIVASPATGALISSGGGFSNVAARPSYQEAAVKKYLADKTKLPAEGDFNATGRGFPDVAALGHNYFIEAGGPNLVDGTSCSAPVWGGVMGLLNSFLKSSGKPLLGFANPTLYQIYAANANAFIDITEGSNTCTEDTCSCSPGFTAAPGWDAATGLGAPVYTTLLAELKKLKGI